ncbi:MAG: hypothetical protein WAM95_23015 [Bacillus sp. (in: firmicutes)]
MKKLISVGIAIVMALTVGFGFVGKADAATSDMSNIGTCYCKGDPYLGKDGHVYVNKNWTSIENTPIEAVGVYKMYSLENGMISAVNVYDDTDIIYFSEKIYPSYHDWVKESKYYRNNGLFVSVFFSEKNNDDYKIAKVYDNHLYLDGLLFKYRWNTDYDLQTFKVSWVDDKYVYLYTKNNLNPHEVKLRIDGFSWLKPGDWVWAKVSEETWKWDAFGEITPEGINYYSAR